MLQEVEGMSSLSLSSCDIGCPTNKYQYCGGNGGNMLLMHSGM